MTANERADGVTRSEIYWQKHEGGKGRGEFYRGIIEKKG